MAAFSGNPEKAQELYKYNIQAAQALYPLISALEVALRNSIDKELIRYFNDDNWLISKRGQFANHPNMVYKTTKRTILQDNFFAELTFGFWVKFFDTSSIKILKGSPLQAFRNKPQMKLNRYVLMATAEFV